MITDNQRALLNSAFEPPERSSWDKFPRALLEEHGLHPRTVLLYNGVVDALLLLAQRRPPTSPRYEGNFPVNKSAIEWLSLVERSDKVHEVFIATIESYDGSCAIIDASRADDVADRVLGRVRPSVPLDGGEPFYWFNQHLEPVVYRGGGGRWRVMRDRPAFLDEEVGE